MKEILITPKNEKHLQEIEAVPKSIGVEFTPDGKQGFLGYNSSGNKGNF